MRLFLIFGLVSGFFCANAEAAPPVVWQGGATLTSLSSTGCTGHGLVPGDMAASVYRPHTSGGGFTSLTFVFSRAAVILNAPTQGGPASLFRGSGTYKSGGLRSRAIGFSGVTGSFNFTITPATISTATKFVTIEGTVGNFLGHTGCTVGIRGSYNVRPATGGD